MDGIDASASAFSGIFSEARLYVPVGTKSIYEATEPWSNFKYIIEGEGGSPGEGGGSTTETPTCATPTIGYADGELTFSCATEGAQYHYAIADSDITAGAFSESGKIDLTATYHISVYASADGHKVSETATATLCFIDASLTTDGISTTGQAKRGIMVRQSDNNVIVSGLQSGESVALYAINGTMLGTAKADIAGQALLTIGGATGVAVLNVGTSAVKIVLK